MSIIPSLTPPHEYCTGSSVACLIFLSHLPVRSLFWEGVPVASKSYGQPKGFNGPCIGGAIAGLILPDLLEDQGVSRHTSRAPWRHPRIIQRASFSGRSVIHTIQ